ncbi:MAG TPA: hypothetical protein VLT45_27120 [Kofleriaceae bacterium]|nr:hypothetical protein [Kofleriaceae bacterium]
MNLTPGLYVQVYRAKVPGAARPQRLMLLDAHAQEWARLGAKGIAWHGFSTELTIDAMRDLTAICRNHSLVSLAAYGMDSSDPTGKGERIGRVLESDVCDGVVLDAEGAWEDDADGDDREHARRFASTFLPHRQHAPGKPVIDQPWPVPTVHWSWPWEEFAECVDARAPQYYVNDWTSTFGRDRFARCVGKFDEAWRRLDARLTPTGHARPRVWTIQGYGWGDIRADLATALKRAQTEPLIVWCEPFPDDAFMDVWRGMASQAA